MNRFHKEPSSVYLISKIFFRCFCKRSYRFLRSRFLFSLTHTWCYTCILLCCAMTILYNRFFGNNFSVFSLFFSFFFHSHTLHRITYVKRKLSKNENKALFCYEDIPKVFAKQKTLKKLKFLSFIP